MGSRLVEAGLIHSCFWWLQAGCGAGRRVRAVLSRMSNSRPCKQANNLPSSSLIRHPVAYTHHQQITHCRTARGSFGECLMESKCKQFPSARQSSLHGALHIAVLTPAVGLPARTLQFACSRRRKPYLHGRLACSRSPACSLIAKLHVW